MFASLYPVRVLLVCPTCKSRACVTRDEWLRAQTFCSVDGVPMIVIGVSAGCPILEREPLFVATTGQPMDLSRYVKPDAIIRSHEYVVC